MKINWKKILPVFILYCILLLPIFYALFTAIDIQYSWAKRIAYFAVVAVGLIVPALFFKRRVYFILEGILNIFFAPIDIASLYLNGQSASRLFLNSIFHTDWAEAYELVLSIWPLAIIVIGIWIIYFFLAWRQPMSMLFPKVVRLIAGISIVVLFVCGLGVFSRFVKKVHPDKGIKAIIMNATDNMIMKFNKIFPYNIYIGTYQLYQDYLLVQEAQSQVQSFSFGIQPVPDSLNTQIILVIGESARFDHFGINGYCRNTTPSLSAKNNLFSFSNAYTQANLTDFSVPLIITRTTADNQLLAHSEKTIMDAFAEAGYKSVFITKNITDRNILIARSMNDCTHSFAYPKGLDVANNFDAEMITKLREFQSQEAQITVLHSLGSHYKYSLRYPDSFDLFQPALPAAVGYTMLSKENKNLLVNAYDNSIAYTDFFLSQVIDYADSLNKPAVVLYVSDHGESFWDDERNLSMHGSYDISEAEYHIPLLVWVSEEYAAHYADKVHWLSENLHRNMTTHVVFHSLLDLAGINQCFDATKSICSPTFMPSDTVCLLNGEGQLVHTSLPIEK